MTPASPPRVLTLDQPAGFLRWLATEPQEVDLSWFDVAEIWSLTALAALARREQTKPVRIVGESFHGTARFARAVGLHEVVENRPSRLPGEEGRTVKLSRVNRDANLDKLAREVSSLVVPDKELEDTRKTIQYVLIELLRNVVQHSQDPLGGVVAAQENHGGRSADRPVVQVAVADCGIGVQASLCRQHPGLEDPQEALDKALWPHFSGTFPEGETGSAENAGMGLFFISEMTKLVGGNLVIATRGATLLLSGDPGHEDGPRHQLGFLARGLGFPGTLVAFEMPSREEQAYDAIIETIRERARQRTPPRAVHKWLRFEPAPSSAYRLMVRVVAEDTARASNMGKDIGERVVQQVPVVLDFTGMQACTQSFVHALLFQALRLAWAVKCPIYVEHVAPPVRSTLELLENYALAG